MSIWNVLIVDDEAEIRTAIAEDAKKGRLLGDNGTANPTECNTFADALKALDTERFDFLVLDLAEGQGSIEEQDQTAGLRVLEELRKRRFVPVVFYTALPNVVRGLESPFVRVVEKTEALHGLRTAFTSIFETRLPALVRHIEDEQRRYMWDVVTEQWKDLKSESDHVDLAYLLARRLSSLLRGEGIRTFLRQSVSKHPVAQDADLADAIELYIHPPVGEIYLAGDIIRATDGLHLVVLTPSCDFANKKVDRVLLAGTQRLEETDEYKNWNAGGRKETGKEFDALQALLRDNRQRKQPERYKFLPSTRFLPDLVVDFQQLQQMTPDDLKALVRVASLDAPFAEALLSRFSRYYGRLGTPNLNTSAVVHRLREATKEG